MGDTEESDRFFTKEAIKFFRSLINRRNNLNIDTRPVNFAVSLALITIELSII